MDYSYRLSIDYAPITLEVGMEIKDQIRIARIATGLSQKELAEKLGVSRQTIVWWEDGDHRPKTGRIREIEEALNVRLDLAERGNATPLHKQKASLSVDPEIMRIAIAIGRLPALHREALVTLINIGEDRVIGTNSHTGKVISDTDKLHPDIVSIVKSNPTASEFSFIEKREPDGKRTTDADQTISKQKHNRNA